MSHIVSKFIKSYFHYSMKRYGLPYMGSKNKIAKWVVGCLPAAPHFYDLFCGGGAVTHAAIEQHRYRYYHLNDISSMAILFSDIVFGKCKPDYRWVSREEFYSLKDTDPLMSIIWSFGNNRKDYLYGKDIEPIKHALHNAVAFCDFALSDALGINLHAISSYSTIAERYSVYSRFIQKKNYFNFCLQNIRSVLQLSRGLFARKTFMGGYNVDLYPTQLDYQDVEILPNSTVYCDIPFRNTHKYTSANSKAIAFDYDRFYAWADSRPYPVFISEYCMPPEFAPIATCRRTGTMCKDHNNDIKIEKIFVQKRYADSNQRQLFLL